MVSGKDVWDKACELARSGEFANVVMIERELRRRGLLSGQEVTANVFKRELLTRVCHAARMGGEGAFTFDTPAHPAAHGVPGELPSMVMSAR